MTRTALALAAASLAVQLAAAAPAAPARAGVIPVEESFVDSGGVLIYVKSIGRGPPILALHGGPGASHDYLLPGLLPLARTHRLVLLDERGSGRSQALDDPSGYTVEAMAADAEAVRAALGLGKVALLGHSFGGVVAQAYALKHPQHLSHLILCSTFHSTQGLNAVFRKMKEKMAPELRAKIDALEKDGLYGKGAPWERGRYTDEYMKLAWGEGYFPYLYQRHPDANYDPVANGKMSWELYREMWGSHGEFVVDGNLKSVEYADRLPSIKVPTLITVGDHDETDPAVAEEMHRLIPGSKLVVLPQSGHMTFVDRPEEFTRAVEQFTAGKKAAAR